MSIDTSTGTKSYVPDFAVGTKTYKTQNGTYTVDLTNKQIDQRDIAALDATVVDGDVQQAKLVAIMQKYDDFVLVNDKGRELDSPADLLREDPDWDEMKDDIGSIFAEAARLFALAAQASRQRQLEEAETSRKDILSLAATEKTTDYAAAAASKSAAVAEAAAGITGAIVGAAGGAYGIYKAGKGQNLAGKQKEHVDLAHGKKGAIKDREVQLEEQTELSKNLISQAKIAKSPIAAKIGQKDAEITKTQDGLDFDVKTLQRQKDQNQSEDRIQDTEAKIDAKSSKIAKLSSDKVKLEGKLKEQDDLISTAQTDRGNMQTKHAKLDRIDSHQLAGYEKDAAHFGAEAGTKGDWGRIMGGAFQALSTGTTMIGKGAAAPANMEAETLRADSKYIAATKESESVMQSQHTDQAAHSRDMFAEALSSARSMQQSTQDTLNRIAGNSA